MNARRYRAVLAEGIPAGNLTSVNTLTVGGVNGSGGRYQRRQSFDEARAAYAVGLNLGQSAAKPGKMKGNPYSKLVSTKYYGAGLGDDSPGLTEDEIAEAPSTNAVPGLDSMFTSTTPAMAPQPSAGSSSGWGDVLNSQASKSIFSGIGTGLATLIGGNKAPAAVLPVTSGAPSLGTMLLIGGAVAIPLFLLFRRS